MVMDQQGVLIRRIDLNQSAVCLGELPLAEPEALRPKLAGVESRVIARFSPGTRLGKLTPGPRAGMSSLYDILSTAGVMTVFVG